MTEAAEPNLAYMCHKIASMADVYHATHTYDGKPKVAGYDGGSRCVNIAKPKGIKHKGPVNNHTTKC